jgi:serine/threonine-protein kinase
VAHRRELAGDLDRIVLKALHKEPPRRYLSAAELAADIDRYLSGYPVTARPDSWGYRTGKFLGRHRLGAAMAAVFIALVLAFAVSMAVFARRAKEEARTADQVTSFLVDLFQSNNPDQTQGATLTARELLDRGAAHLEGQLKTTPESRHGSSIRSAVSTTRSACGPRPKP